MRLGSDPFRGLRCAELCSGLGSTALSGMCLEARPLGTLADDLPIGLHLRPRSFGRSLHQAGRSNAWQAYFPAMNFVEVSAIGCAVPSISMVRASLLAAARPA